jgi:hypothetical protein
VRRRTLVACFELYEAEVVLMLCERRECGNLFNVDLWRHCTAALFLATPSLWSEAYDARKDQLVSTQFHMIDQPHFAIKNGGRQDGGVFKILRL